MEIDPINNKKKTEKEIKKRKIKNLKSGDVSDNSINQSSGFFDVLLDTQIEISEKELKILVDNVINAGNKFVKSPTSSNLRSYKQAIKEFLKRLEKHWYVIKSEVDYKNSSPKLHVVAQIVDEKIKELTDVLLKKEKRTIIYASTIEEINGLLLDLYQ